MRPKPSPFPSRRAGALVPSLSRPRSSAARAAAFEAACGGSIPPGATVPLPVLYTLRRVAFDEPAARRRVHVAGDTASADDVDRLAEDDRSRIVTRVRQTADALP